MDEKEFVELVKETVAECSYAQQDEKITADDVYIVWLCKTLQNSKALASTTLYDGRYYELTYNGDKGELYVDVYKKDKNYTVIV